MYTVIKSKWTYTLSVFSRPKHSVEINLLHLSKDTQTVLFVAFTGLRRNTNFKLVNKYINGYMTDLPETDFIQSSKYDKPVNNFCITNRIVFFFFYIRLSVCHYHKTRITIQQ